SDFWPNPRLVGVQTDPDFWFRFGDPNNVECALVTLTEGGAQSREDSRPAKTTEADSRVIAGTYIPVKGYPAGLWEAELRLYRRLSEHPELQPAGSPEAAWFFSAQNTSVGALGNIYLGILELSRYDQQEQDALDAAAENFQDAANALAAKDQEFGEALDNPALLEQLLAEREALEAALAAATAEYQNLFESARDVRRNSALQLLDLLDPIQTAAAYETDFKTVCRILLETYLDGVSLSAENCQNLKTIAAQCRYSGGMAVLQARAALPDNQDYAQYDDCPVEYGAPYATQKARLNPARLSPNPARHSTTLQLDRPVASGRAILRDVNGRIVNEWPLDGLRHLDLRWSSDLHPGLYFLDVLSEQNEPEVLRLTIYK
ncbi:MAG: hypothetical protein JNK89_06380, partial [Saprospiraceae bacterium]|nr:hypothetical protein [Saprospiraceae bacterium]